jgi:DNA mismatch repair protein MutL
VSPIRILPPSVANRIAAGEVVERPASLVKELVENSLDAGATRVEVTFEDGGLELIRVSDDGCGIPAEEAKLAFERHATSKVWDPADLAAIGTFGFRGEALASIAAVSRVEMRTATESAPGTRIQLEAGAIVEKKEAARGRGTTIEVTGLFFNTPARRKFLRAAATEGRVLVRAIVQLALGAAGVGFKVTREGRVVLDIPPSAGFRERAEAFFGAEAVRRMVEVRGARDGVGVGGLVSPSDFSRQKAAHQVLLVNGRPVVDAALAHAVALGVGGAIPGGKHPKFALAVDVSPEEVDVNVHPTKREVRFRRKDLVFSVVREAVGAGVLELGFDALGRAGAFTWRTGRPAPAARVAPTVPAAAPPPLPWTPGGGFAPSTPRGARGEESAPQPSLTTHSLRLVGELWGAYLVVEDADRLLVIDQHAAHERVLYDEIRSAATGSVPVQGLLVPLAVDLAPGQEPEEVAEVLRDVGFDARAGGPSSILVDGVPGHLSQWGGGEFLRELFASAEGAKASAEKLRDALAKSYSCRGAVKFGQRLHPEEIEHLLRGLERTAVPRLCPHGRPIYLELPRAQIDDRFER